MSRYLIALGSNVRHARHGGPADVLRAALSALKQADISVCDTAAIVPSAPLGASRRCYANTVAVVNTDLDPPDLLTTLKAIERKFGRRAGGRRWSARVLDLDIVLWGGGAWFSRKLNIPHPEFRRRGFVLVPAQEIAAQWRDPLTGLTLRQLHHRLMRSKPRHA